MVQFCCVVGCGNRSNREIRRFYRLPNIPKTCDRASYKAEIILRRRKQWLLNIRRADLKYGDEAYSPGYIRVCSDHFHSGKPSVWSDVDNIDWAPTVKMGYDANAKNHLTDIVDIQFSNNKKKPRKSTEAKRAMRIQELELRMTLGLVGNSKQKAVKKQKEVKKQNEVKKRKGKVPKKRILKTKITKQKKGTLIKEELKTKRQLLDLVEAESTSDSIPEEKLTVNPIIHKITLDCIVSSPEVKSETEKHESVSDSEMKDLTSTSDVKEEHDLNTDVKEDVQEEHDLNTDVQEEHDLNTDVKEDIQEEHNLNKGYL